MAWGYLLGFYLDGFKVYHIGVTWLVYGFIKIGLLGWLGGLGGGLTLIVFQGYQDGLRTLEQQK